MIYIESPNSFNAYGNKNVFLAGGITDCPDWQSDMVELLKTTDYTLLNPRRQNFPIHDPNAFDEQVTWEHDALRHADLISFWFPKETLCPIVLYELGAWSMTDKPICVGLHSGYERRRDVEIQTRLARSEVNIVYSLKDLQSEIIRGIN